MSGLFLPRTRGVRLWLRVVRSHRRTVTVAAWSGGALTMPCPAWCAGHDRPEVEQHPVDFAHEGHEFSLGVVTDRGGSTGILAAGLAWAPLSDRDPHLRMTVDLGAGRVEVNAAEVRTLADGLVRHAEFLREFSDTYEVLRAQTDESMRPAGIPAWLPPLQGLDEIGS